MYLYKKILLHKQYLHRIIQVNYTIFKQQQLMLKFRTRLSLVVAQRSMYNKYRAQTKMSPLYCLKANDSRLYYFTLIFLYITYVYIF